MSSQTQPSTGKQAPDTATSYERAKPSQESPHGQLDQEETGQGKEQDQLRKQDSQPAAKPEHLKEDQQR